VDTPLGPIKAHSKGVPLFVPGIPDYPRGHRTVNDADGDGADVTLKMVFVSMKFVALRFETDDSMDQVMAFYKSKLASLGTVTVDEGGPNTDLDRFSWASRPGDRTLGERQRQGSPGRAEIQGQGLPVRADLHGLQVILEGQRGAALGFERSSFSPS